MTLDDPPPAPDVARSPVGDLLRRWLPLSVVVAAATLLLRRAASPLDDPDIWWHLRLGDELWRQRSFTAPSDWSPRQTVDWAPSEPLPEILAARMEHWWGLASLAWLYGLGLLLVMLFVYWTCRREANAAVASVVTVLATWSMYASLTPRPQLISFVLIGLVPVAWNRAADTLAPPWWLVPMTWFWSMCHGFWILGVGLSGLCWLGLVLDRRPTVRDALRLACVPLASFLVVLLNPAGWGVITAPLSVSDTTQYISEWARTSYKHPSGIVCAVLIALLVALMVSRRREVQWTELLLLGAAVFFWWYALRTLAVSAVVVAPLLARYVTKLERDQPVTASRRQELGVLAVGTMVGLVVLSFVVPATSATPGGVPSDLSDELDQLPPGTSVLNAYELGGWLAWRHPKLDRTSDGLVVPYDPDYIGDLVRIQNAEGDWLGLVDEIDVDYALMPEQAEVSTTLEDEGWVVVGTGNGVVLLSRPGVTFPAG